MSFVPFDPLQFKTTSVTDAAIGSLKREIENILSSYVGWYDPFCELIQNALDAVEARTAIENAAGTGKGYTPTIRVLINLDENALTVSDNGVGLDKERFQQFLVPSLSFKSGKTRGHKGVGATYVAYGFNYMRIATKAPGFEATGRIVGARDWIVSNVTGGNPKVEPDSASNPDVEFNAFDRGVSITVRFDDKTHPRRLDWIQATSADTWSKILSIKTGLGSVVVDTSTHVAVLVRRNGAETCVESVGTRYLWLHDSAPKTARIRAVADVQDDLYRRFGAGRKMPDRYNNLDFLYETWTASELKTLLGNTIDSEEQEVLDRHTPIVMVEFGYTAKLWSQFNEGLGLRSNYRVLTSGIQLAANNMPQGEPIQIPLNRSIGRQNQLHFLVHFDAYTPDMGRKGFHRELTDFVKGITKKITEHHLSKFRGQLKANTGVAPDLVREMKIAEWKEEMVSHERSQPLNLGSRHFFKPTERIGITSVPTREQDVIALFHQLVAGGVIRGISALSTNERFTYDGLYRVQFDLAEDLYLYNQESNPLGVSTAIAKELHGKVSQPRVLEYKFSLDGLVEDFDNLDKNIRDIDLCIAWSTGDLYCERYGISSLLLPENADQRQYHGVTHVMSDLESGAKQLDLIILEELIEYLNDPASAVVRQRGKYE